MRDHTVSAISRLCSVCAFWQSQGSVDAGNYFVYRRRRIICSCLLNLLCMLSTFALFARFMFSIDASRQRLRSVQITALGQNSSRTSSMIVIDTTLAVQLLVNCIAQADLWFAAVGVNLTGNRKSSMADGEEMRAERSQMFNLMANDLTRMLEGSHVVSELSSMFARADSTTSPIGSILSSILGILLYEVVPPEVEKQATCRRRQKGGVRRRDEGRRV